MPENLMTEEEYREHPAMNFSSLSSFYNKGVDSPDHALMKFEFKSYFEFGKMFETMLQDLASGSKEFEKRFFKSTVNGKMPDDMIMWIDEGENLEDHIKLKKDGSRNMQSKTKHAFIDEALENPGKIPVSTKDWSMLERLSNNMLKMEYLEVKVCDLLAKAKWQVPIIFIDVDGIEKKALLDCLVDLGGKFLPIDIKTAANFQKFGFMLRDKYFLQEIQYTSAVSTAYGPCDNMPFFVASKEAPFLCQPWEMDYGNKDAKFTAVEEYLELCQNYKKWSDAGRWPKGWLPLHTQTYFVKN